MLLLLLLLVVVLVAVVVFPQMYLFPAFFFSFPWLEAEVKALEDGRGTG